MTHLLSWPELFAIAAKHDIPVSFVPFCRCSTHSQNPRSEDRSPESPSRDELRYAGRRLRELEARVRPGSDDVTPRFSEQ
jgi:hypothetical protein